MLGGILMVLMFLVALFLVLLVLIQRGRGGGLAGAFGGMGGQSAFGTKAGDLFTRITIVAAAIWVLLCVAAVKYYNTPDSFSTTLGGKMRIDVQPGGKLPATGAMPDAGGTGKTTEAAPAQTPGTEGATPGETPAATEAPAASTPAATEAPAETPPAEAPKQ